MSEVTSHDIIAAIRRLVEGLITIQEICRSSLMDDRSKVESVLSLANEVLADKPQKEKQDESGPIADPETEPKAPLDPAD